MEKQPNIAVEVVRTLQSEKLLENSRYVCMIRCFCKSDSKRKQ
jgi:hypothetical protein